MLTLLADAPALPLDEAGKYVAGAYIVFVVLIVVYVAIMAAKLQRIERELRDLAGFAEARAEVEGAAPGRSTEGSYGEPPGRGTEGSYGEGAAPGRGSEGQSISVSPGPSESRGGGADV